MKEVSIFTKLANRGINYLYRGTVEDQESAKLIRLIIEGKSGEFRVAYRDLLSRSREDALKIKEFKRAYTSFPKIDREVLKDKDRERNEIYFSAFRLKIEQRFLVKKTRASINRYLMSLLEFSMKDKRYLRLFMKIIRELGNKQLESLYSGILKLLDMGFKKDFLIVKDSRKIRVLDTLIKVFKDETKISNLAFQSIMKMWAFGEPIKVIKKKTEIVEVDPTEVLSTFRPIRVGKPLNYAELLERGLKEELKKLEGV